MNGYDCGVYVLWDIYCLSCHGAVLPRSPEEITAWRPALYARIQSLDPYIHK
jgi:Ulp1 family protease